MLACPNDIISRLQKEILCLQGYKTIQSTHLFATGLGPIRDAFPNKHIPVSTIHEFICSNTESTSSTNGFVSALTASLMKNGGACIWISSSMKAFPSAMPLFGMEPHRVIFVHATKEKDILWAAEEALKSNGLAAVIAETKELSFTASRRLQLAVEKSQVTGFLIRQQPRILTPNVCSARWAISPVASELPADMPGVGFPRWKVALLKVRNGKTGEWIIEWDGTSFKTITPVFRESKFLHRKTG
ncbi:Error-prone repair protein ImuA [Terrimonas sp. NA20]|uniref:Error-prone repair protein ImuA n=1 Tax=Terrimonas ginsenosidimutans TaxID=2908004 RepID=A0ABS9KKY9_9BACT|nr:Error-prone repair protein ImuA [Terrimonas ginsenosidimutans]MCG2612971.1 Error-prone repair protein ImuA [Terrimonas ginsenosidimutans]